MRERRVAVLLTSAALVGSLAACSSLFGPEVVVRPVERLSAASPQNTFYESAVAAINDRNYGRALDYLQAAKERNPTDVKVLNALGVVYDKLGRFDLSSRYYTQAAALDPGSRIVAANTAYSRALQSLNATDVAANSTPSSVAEALSGTTPGHAVASLAAQPALATGGTQAKQTAAASRAPTLQPTAAIGRTMPQQAAVSLPSQSPFATAVIQPKQTVVASRAPNLQPPAAVGRNMPQQAAVSLPAQLALTKSSIQPRPTAAVARASSQQPAATAGRTLPRQAAAPLPAPAARAKSDMQPKQEAAASRAPDLQQVAAAGHTMPQQLAASFPAQPALAKGGNQPKQTVAVSRAPNVQPAVAIGGTTLRRVAASLSSPLSLATGSLQPKPATAVSHGGMRPANVKAMPYGVVLTGHPLKVINGTDREILADLVRQRLAALGWTVARAPNEPSKAQPLTIITYQMPDLAAAQALARTLPFPARLAVNSCNCGGVALVLGADFRGWKTFLPPRVTHKAPTVVAAIAAKLSTGVR